jgi:toxin ParE1/3/4
VRTLEYRRRAGRDLDGIKDYIARDNPRRALSFIRELRRICEQLAENPLMGRARPELRPGLRSFPHGDYLIFYRPLRDGVSVVRVLHGSREAGRLL